MSRAVTVLLIDCDRAITGELRSRLAALGLAVEVAVECMDALHRLREHEYAAVVLDPVIRECLNGYVVDLELEQPEMLEKLFLFTGMSSQTIQRTAPALISRFFQKPAEMETLVQRIVEQCAPSTHVDADRASLLLVEDDPPTATATALLVAERGYAVTYAVNGSEAIAALSRDAFDAIILDLILPGVDGFAVLEYLQAAKPHLLGRVIVTSGIPEKYAHGLEHLGICGVLRKPIALAELERLLDACVAEELPLFEAGGEAPIAG